MGKKFMMKVQVLQCIACHGRDTLLKLNKGAKADIRMCKICFDKLSIGQTIITPDKSHKLYTKNGNIIIAENKEDEE